MTNGNARGGRAPQLIVAVVMTVFCLGAVEVAVRGIARTDDDGNVYVRQRQVVFQPPVHRVEAAVRAYRQLPNSLFVDDSTLGWKPRPGAHNELYAYDSAGRRNATADVPAVAPGAGLRIAIFGDSFAHGSEVHFEESWAHRLEIALADRRAASGTDASRVQVRNFGVPGYGMDQAFLRWEQEGRAAKPDVVVFAMQVENAHRNVNLLRPLYDAADLPFAKPRFVASRDRLELVNVPVPRPEDVPRILGQMETWPLARYERYYRPRPAALPLWRHSALATLVHGIVAERSSDPARELTAEERELSLGIVREFARSVEAAGARFVIVHLPTRGDLEHRKDAGVVPNSVFIAEASAFAPIVRTERALVGAVGGKPLASLFRPGGHYTAAGNAAVAAAAADYLRSELAGDASVAPEHLGNTVAN